MPKNLSPGCRQACHVQTDGMAAVLLTADGAKPYHTDIASAHFNEGQSAGIPSHMGEMSVGHMKQGHARVQGPPG